MNMEDHESYWKRSEFYTDKNFIEEYRLHKIAMQHIAECAKIYIVNNWEKVTDWSNLNVLIKDNTKVATKYYNHIPKSQRKEKTSKAWDRLMKSMEKERSKEHNPVKTVEGIVLDTSDGDFSLTINGKDHLWIHDVSVLIIADYIEKQLKETI